MPPCCARAWPKIGTPSSRRRPAGATSGS